MEGANAEKPYKEAQRREEIDQENSEEIEDLEMSAKRDTSSNKVSVETTAGRRQQNMNHNADQSRIDALQAPMVDPATGEQINRWFALSDESLYTIKGSVGRELELGLRDEEAATIKMLITYVRELSRGDEVGTYLALDLGGTHFRVLLVTLNGDGSEPRVTSTMHDIPLELLRTQNGQELFDYIAVKLLEFVQTYKLKKRRISLGFTFSFPCKQYGLTQSILVKWCKGFNVGGVVGTDVVKQLKNALKRQLAGRVQAYIDVVAVINDTTGTLVACANKHRDCRIGLIVGTGFNACYMERLDKCEKWPANYTNPKQVIVNCEWGAMGDNKVRRELDKFRNEFDVRIDKESVNQMNQTYEKMVAGMYVGELLRLSMLKLISLRQLFASDAQIGPSQAPSLTQMRSNGSLLGCDPLPSIKSGRLASISSPSSARPEAAVETTAPRAPEQRSGCVAQQPATSELDAQPAARSRAVNSDVRGAHKLLVRNVLNGRHLSMLALDELSGGFTETEKLMRELNIGQYSDQDLAVVVRLGGAIMRRAASLVACGISALLERMRRPFTVIGYDGSLIKHHPYFLRVLTEKTRQLTQREFRFEFVQSSDGSGIGAAVVAAALHKERRPLYVVKPGKLYEMHCVRNPQSQLSFEGNLGTAAAGTVAGASQVVGLERVGSASSRASDALSASSQARK